MKVKIRAYLEFKKYPQGQPCNVSRGIKGSGVCQAGSFLETQVHRWNSSVLVQNNLNLFQHERLLKLLFPPRPHLLSEQNGGWIRREAPRKGRGQASQHHRLLRGLCIEGAMLTTGLAVSFWGLSSWHALPGGSLLCWKGSTVLNPLTIPVGH